jgi:hypothetical protein
MVLEGGMVAAAVILLTVLCPGLVFGREGWQEAAWTLSGKEKRHASHEKLVQSKETTGV